jgi:hypothetical protein
MAVWVVVGVIGVGALAAALASRRPRGRGRTHGARISQSSATSSRSKWPVSEADARATRRHAAPPDDARLRD